MQQSYTELVSDYYLNLTDKEIYKIRAQIENAPEDTDRTEWKRLIRQIAEEYTYSSRRYLIRFLHAASDENANVPPKQADRMSPEETESYVAKLIHIAAPSGALSDSEEKLIRKGMHTYLPKNKETALLTREEAFALGHLLHFSVKQMQEFLVRSFEDGGFDSKTANDLIEMFGFLNDYDTDRVAELKRAYEECTFDIEKAADQDYDRSYTGSLETALGQKLKIWQASGQDVDSSFLEWMMQQSPYLDTPSRSRRSIYRNLSVFAYELCKGEISMREIDADHIVDQMARYLKIEEIPETVAVLDEAAYESQEQFRKGICRKIANTLFEEHYFESSSERNYATHEWSILSTKENGEPTATSGVSSKNGRVEQILAGMIQPEKADVLFLIWFVLNKLWSWTENDSAEDIFYKLADLMDVSDQYLSRMLLPEFYPPHVLEQSLLLSIVSSSENQTPVEIYERICASLFAVKNKTSGARKHTTEEKLSAVREYLDNPKNMKRICEKYQCSNKSIYGWQKSLEKKGLI